MFRDYGIFVITQGFEKGFKRALPTISHGDNGVTPESGQFCTADWRPAKHPAKFVGLHFGKPIQRGVYQAFAWLKFLSRRGRRFSIPRADVLADVATEHVRTHALPQVLWKTAAFFDRQIGDAFGGIQLVRRNEGVRGASIDAACAGSTTIGCGKIRSELKRS